MCIRPVNFNGQLVACRTCDQCLASRKNTWVSRAMAEKAMWNHTFMITLTYKEGNNPHIGSRVFRYKDIQDFMKRLRKAYHKHHNDTGKLRFLVTGERGSKGTKRIHWHLILFTDKPLGVLGEWRNFQTGQLIAEPELDVRYNWTIWPYGFCHLELPDRKGMAYVLKYILKDQFLGNKTRMENRHHKSDNYGASLFRQSRLPEIGVPFLLMRLEQLRSLGAVPPAPNVQVPDGGYWFIRGPLREWWLLQLRAINLQIREATGRDAPQWAALLSAVTNKKDPLQPNSDWETLYYGKIEKAEFSEDAHDGEHAYIARKVAGQERAAATARTARRCGHIVPCEACKVLCSDNLLRQIYTEEVHAFRRYLDQFPNPHKTRDEHKSDFDKWWPNKGHPSEGCTRKDSAEVRQALRAWAALAKLGQNARGKRTFPRGSKEV